MIRRSIAALLLVALAGLAACNTPPSREPFPKRLSDWNLFKGRMADLRLNPGVIPYDLNTPLFSDYAGKTRTVWMPAGQSARYDPVKTFQFPAGTILSKTFSFDGKHIETRLLVRTEAAWVPLPYVWNDAQNQAILEIAADPVKIRTQSPAGETLDMIAAMTGLSPSAVKFRLRRAGVALRRTGKVPGQGRLDLPVAEIIRRYRRWREDRALALR